jgi:beta-hydroxylase
MGLIVLAIFIGCAAYVQTRGRVQHAKLSRKLADHSNFLAPINCLFYFFSKNTQSAYIDPAQFPELDIFKNNWQAIRDEALLLNNAEHIKASTDLDDVGFNSFFKTGWKRFYLKWYGANLHSAEKLCPYTLSLINQLPNVKGAMFTMLPPGAKLVKHRDPYAGSLRYHLGLVTPNHDDCYIDVDGTRYSWRDGEVVMFDETYIHYAENKTDHNRIILFLDVKRPVDYKIIDWINEGFSRLVVAASATKNLPGDKVGLLNKVFSHIYQLRLFGKKIKAVSPPLYYGLQLVIYGLLIYWIFL